MRRPFIPWVGYSQSRKLAAEWALWLPALTADWFVTLNFNRETQSLEGARHQFGQWLARLDRKFLGRRWSQRGGRRTFAVGFIEHPSTNLHVHANVTLPERARGLDPFLQLSWMRAYWDRLQPAGSLQGTPIYDHRGAGRYMTKGLNRLDHFEDQILLSTEFHD